MNPNWGYRPLAGHGPYAQGLRLPEEQRRRLGRREAFLHTWVFHFNTSEHSWY